MGGGDDPCDTGGADTDTGGGGDNEPPNKGETSAEGEEPEFKKTKSGQSGKEAASDVPSWARGERPTVKEDGKAFAQRLMDRQYGKGNWKGKQPGSEYIKIKKWGDRGFE